MFSKILGKSKTKEENSSAIDNKIASMNLTEMRAYVNNKISDL
jgi:hypothetical protein